MRNSRRETERALAAEQYAQKVQNEVHTGLTTLQTATGGARVVAHRNLYNSISKYYGDQVQEVWNSALASINFDQSLVESELLGDVRSLTWVPVSGNELSKRFGEVPSQLLLQNGASELLVKVEIFRDWIIYGQEAYDIDSTTRMEVYLEGSKQLGPDGSQVDLRTAEIQFTSANWAKRIRILSDDGNEARHIASQLNLITESLKPSTATAADITSMLNAILNNSGHTAAERIEQLSALRYQRLLSDEEFEAAKTKVLGI